MRKSSFALRHFLRNVCDIQANYPASELVIATDEPDFVGELESLLREYDLLGRVIFYRTEKPDHAKDHRIWSMTFGREAIREYVLSREASYLISLDADMTYDPKIVDIMKREIPGSDVLQSGYMMRSKRINAIGFGLGCSLIRGEVLRKIKFRCLEFDTGQVIEEGNMFEIDLFRHRFRLKKGIYLSINHYSGADEMVPIEPGKLNLFKRAVNTPIIRYGLLQTSILLKYDVTRYFQRLIYSRY